jgi:hypothetical protein
MGSLRREVIPRILSGLSASLLYMTRQVQGLWKGGTLLECIRGQLREMTRKSITRKYFVLGTSLATRLVELDPAGADSRRRRKGTSGVLK